MMSRIVLAFVCLLWMCSASTAAQTPSSSQGACAPEACPVLTLDAVLEQVVRTNPEARAFRLEADRAQAELLDARGGFDPYLSANYEYKTDDAKDKLNVLRSGMTVPFDVWMSPRLTLDYRRGLGSSVDPSVVTDPEGETRFGVAVLPLQGLGLDKRRAALRKARLEPRRADALQAEQQNRLVLDATAAFWTWVEARQTLQIHRDLLTLALQRRDFIVREARAGEAAAMDSVEAELSVARRQGKVAVARRKADEARIKLAVFLWDDDGAPERFRYAPPTLPAAIAEREDRPGRAAADSAVAVRTALARRPELRAVQVKARQMRIERQLARQQIRPDVKLEAQVVSYDSRPSALNDVKLGFSITQPLFFRSGRSEAERATIETQAIRLKQELLRRKVRADVKTALVALRQSRRRVALAVRRANLAERLQVAEQRRFELGESTLFLVNQREQAFAEAQEERVAARVALLQAAATFRWATGTIADGMGIRSGSVPGAR